MALTFLARRPDSGLGNIRSSPGDPSRNVDWILLGTQGRSGNQAHFYRISFALDELKLPNRGNS